MLHKLKALLSTDALRNPTFNDIGNDTDNTDEVKSYKSSKNKLTKDKKKKIKGLPSAFDGSHHGHGKSMNEDEGTS